MNDSRRLPTVETPIQTNKAGTNLTPRQAEAKEVVDTLTSRMQELAGQDGIGRDLPDGQPLNTQGGGPLPFAKST